MADAGAVCSVDSAGVVELKRRVTVVDEGPEKVMNLLAACVVVGAAAVDLRMEERRGCIARKRWLGDIIAVCSYKRDFEFGSTCGEDVMWVD